MPTAPEATTGIREIWARVRHGGELRPLVCLALTVATGALLAGLAIGGAWSVGAFLRSSPNTIAGQPGFDRGDVREEDIVTGLIAAGVAWLIVLFFIWRPAIALQRNSGRDGEPSLWARPLIATAVFGAVTVLLSTQLTTLRYDDSQYAVTAAALIGGGAVLFLWLPAIFRLELGKAVRGRAGMVNVHCPTCAHAMNGLTHTTCPECGRAMTIDELIALQGYEGSLRSQKVESRAVEQ